MGLRDDLTILGTLLGGRYAKTMRRGGELVAAIRGLKSESAGLDIRFKGTTEIAAQL